MNYYSNSNLILKDTTVDITTNIPYYKIGRGGNYFSVPIMDLQTMQLIPAAYVRITNVKISF